MNIENMSRKDLNNYIKKLKFCIENETNTKNINIYKNWLDQAENESLRRYNLRELYIKKYLNK